MGVALSGSFRFETLGVTSIVSVLNLIPRHQSKALLHLGSGAQRNIPAAN